MNRLPAILSCLLLLLNCRTCMGCTFCSATKRDIAVIQVAELESGLALFEHSLGRYPTTVESLRALVEGPGAPGWDGPYLKKLPDDPWGRPYHYRSPGIHGDYDLLSYGQDGKPGGEGEDRDVTSWPNL